MLKLLFSLTVLAIVSMVTTGITWDSEGFKLDNPRAAIGVFLLVIALAFIYADVSNVSYSKGYVKGYSDSLSKYSEELDKLSNSLDSLKNSEK